MTLKSVGFPHSEILGSKPVGRLPEAYRKLQRPSSPSAAKASTRCACSLDHITQRTYRPLSSSSLNFSPDIPAVPPRSADCGIALLLPQAHRTIFALTGAFTGRAECFSQVCEKHGFISFKLLKNGLLFFLGRKANIKTSLVRFDIGAH